MDTFKSFTSEIYEVNDQSFDGIALAVFRYQAKFNALYSAFLRQLKVDPNAVTALQDIPFLPVSFFKTHTIQTSQWAPETVFTSSGTSGTSPSRHFVRNTGEYLANAQACFEYFFGPVSECHFLALLPSYLERDGSSLIAMMDHLIRQSGSEHSGFYLNEHELLLNRLFELRGSKRKVILWGVSFALMDLAYSQQADLGHCVVFETGGMKGRRREITREEMHNVINERLRPAQICSEYGMTELFSQAYTSGGFAFKCPPKMKVIGRDLTDPFLRGVQNETCGINIIDLANWSTISFIETEDIGKAYADGSFEILGRMDNSEVRGCNLLL